MLVHLTPQQAIEFWPVLKWHIAKALPYGESDKNFGKIISAINKGSLHVLVYVVQVGEEQEKDLKAVVSTTLNIDNITGDKNFVIYTFTGNEGLSKEQLIEIQNGLVNFAKGLHCSKIIFYTTNEKIKSLSKQLGYKEVSTVFSLEV